MVVIPFALDLVPEVRVGPFVFGRPLPARFEEALVRLPGYGPGDTDVHWGLTRGPFSPFIVTLDRGRVAEVAMHLRCLVNGRNLIGVSVGEALQILAASPTEICDKAALDIPYQEIFFDQFSLMLTAANGVVETVEAGTWGQADRRSRSEGGLLEET